MRRAIAIATLGLSLSSCAPSYADGYLEAMAHGLRAQNAGRYEEAEAAFKEAGELGARYKDRDEARLAEAEALEKLGKYEDAEALYRKIEMESDGRYHGVRAAFALGRLVWEQRGFEEGSTELLRAVRKYPASGLVRHAIRRMLSFIEDRDGSQAALDWLKPIEEELRSTEAGEAASYEYATLLARCDRKEDSLAELLALARRYPYPKGSLTDDAYFVASLWQEDFGRYDDAIATLREMLTPQETAYAGASLDRPRWPMGQYRIAVLYRDRLNDPIRAKAEFWRVYEKHFDSRQTDDALWQIARLETAEHHDDETCRVMKILVKEKPDSRYVRCAHHLCADVPATDKPCSANILDSLGLDPDAEWDRYDARKGATKDSPGGE
ncbi:MAG: tetratricopeptide repeat protein [Polyangiaceae bacterium]